jgi:capsular polysaccharide export protein
VNDSEGMHRVQSGRRQCSRDAAGPVSNRSFLFLQGMANVFFARLGAVLVQRGHAVHRINLNGGDALFWNQPGAIDFRRRQEDWSSFLIDVLRARAVTDIILFGDCRPLHRTAIEIAKRRDVSVHVFEEGYLRPGWITCELGGVNGYSSLPRDPDYYRDAAADLPAAEIGRPPQSSFFRRALQDVLYHSARIALHWRYPHYRIHAPVSPFLEYMGFIGRVPMRSRERRRAAALMPRLKAARFFLFPMQLESDYQLRVHSGFSAGLRPALEEVVGSFAAYAPADTLLVIKRHPLDNGMTNWGRVIERIAAEAGVAGRVVYLVTDDLDDLLRRTAGVVTINSTVGALALAMGRPLVVLGKAIYDVDGLTFQGGLDRFWQETPAPDADLFAAFRRVLTHRCLIAGDFFSDEGVRSAIENAVRRLEDHLAPLASNSYVHRLPSRRTAVGSLAERLR